MKQAWAVILDSFREASASRVFQVLLGVTAALLIGVLSMSFEAPDYRPRLDRIFRDMAQGGSIQELSAESRGSFEVDVRARLAFADPRGYLKMLADWKARRVSFQKNYFMADTKIEEEGEGESYRLRVRILGRSKERESFSLGLADVDQEFREGLAAELATRQIKIGAVEVEGQEGWKRTVRLHGTTSDYHLAQGCKVSMLFGAFAQTYPHQGIAGAVFFLQAVLFEYLAGLFGVLLAVIACASFVPNMLQKGAVELWLVRPVGRARLLALKYLGAFTFILPLAVGLFGGTFLILSLKTGYWNWGFLLTIVTVTLNFGVLHSVSMFCGILWKSPIISILAAMGIWFSSFSVYQAYSYWLSSAPDWASAIVRALRYALPRVSEFTEKTVGIMYDGAGLDPGLLGRGNIWPTSALIEILAVSMGFALVCFIASAFAFTRQDY